VIYSGIEKMVQNIISELEQAKHSNTIQEIKSISSIIGEQWAQISYLMDLYVANLI
jgi:hypothetical protein